MASDSTGINVINVIRKTDTAGYLQRPYLRKKADVSDPETGSRIDRMVGRNKKISALPVFQRRYIHIGFEVFFEMGHTSVSDETGDLGDREVGVFKIVSCFLDTVDVNILTDGIAGDLFEQPAHIILT